MIRLLDVLSKESHDLPCAGPASSSFLAMEVEGGNAINDGIVSGMLRVPIMKERRLK